MNACASICLLVLTAVLELHATVSSVSHDHIIYVNGFVGQNSNDCLTSNSASSPCRELDWVFQQPQARLNSTNYVLSEGTHYLTQPSLPFQDLTSLAFTGSGSNVTCTQPETGLAFINVVDISFHNISFFYCERVRNSTSYNFVDNSISKFRVGLYFCFCESISMEYVSVSHSPNATGVVIYDTNGTNSFTYCNFLNNTFINPFKSSGSSLIDNSLYPGGGGFYVEFTYCEPGLTCDSPITERNSGANYTFTSCAFSRNQADNLDTDDHSTYIVPHGTDHEAFGRGGGLSLFLNGDAHGINFEVQNCSVEGNKALWGGGIFIEMHDNAWGNTITISETKFVNNSCPYTIYEGTEGGGMRIGLYVYGPLPKDALRRNDVTVQASNFIGNSALHGGGISISASLQNSTTLDTVALVHLLVNTFESNVAKMGSALNVDRFGYILVGLMVNVVVVACTFRSNTISYAQYIHQGSEPYQLGFGTVHIDGVPVWFLGDIIFEHNNGSGVAVTGTMISFRACNAVFRQNHGNRGAGIALLGAAYLQIDNGTSMLFEGNQVITEGGAIYNAYIERENLKSDSNCFIHHANPFLSPDDWNANLTFVDNYDLGGTHYNAIHSTSILPCSVPGGSGITNNTANIFCWAGWTYSNGNCTAAITSDIGKLTFINGNTTSVYPGWRFNMPIKLVDDLNNTMKGESFTITYNDTNTVTVTPKESVLVSGAPNTSVIITLESLGNRVWHFDLVVNLKQCPPGFVAENTSGYVQCVCSDLYGGAILCDEASQKMHLLNGMWMGKLDKTEEKYFVMDCPLSFCEKRNERYREFDYSSNEYDLDKTICGGAKRRGINCAECIEGYGPAVNSPSFDCVPCTNISLTSNIAKYVASVYLPLAFLFSVLIVFDIRLTTGPANAFILYSQVVSSTFDLNADGGVPHSSTVLSAYRFPFGILNLEFIEDYIPSFCFSPSFTTLSIFLLDYAVALFPLFMILVVIVCLKVSESCCLKNQRLSVQQKRVFLSISRLASLLSRNKKKNINDALLPAFASFLLLSYTKFNTTSSYILNTQHPIDSSGSQGHIARVYYAAQYSVHDKEYLFYQIPALVVFATIVILLPLILLEYPLKIFEWITARVKCLRAIYPVDKIHLFLNMFQGCYRSKMRFFAGLYFLFRFVINVSYIATDTWLQQFLVQQAATTIMIALLALCQPYEKKHLNYVDILIFTNLAILNSISFYLFSFVKIDPNLNPSSSALTLQYVLVFLPLLYMIGYVVWNVTRRYHVKIKEMYRLFTKKIKKRFRRDGYEPLNSDSDEDVTTSIMGKPPPRSFLKEKEFESDFDAMLSRAEDQNTYMPSVTMSRSMTVIEVSGKHGEGEARAIQTRISEDSGLRSSQASPGTPGFGASPGRYSDFPIPHTPSINS